MPRKMIRGGLQRYDEDNDFSYKISNKKLLKSVTDFVREQQTNYFVFLDRQPNTTLMKRLIVIQ